MKRAKRSGRSGLAQRFSAALAPEEEHLSRINGWHEREVLAQAT